MKKLLMTLIILSNAACIASEVEWHAQEAKKEQMFLESYKKLGMEANPYTGDFDYLIRGISTSMPHHVQRFLQNSDRYEWGYNRAYYRLFRIYDGTDKNNIKKIKSEKDITDVQNFIKYLNVENMSIWPTRSIIDTNDKSYICWHVIVGFKSNKAQDLYYAQKIARRLQALSISPNESETESISQIEDSNQN